MITQKMIKRTEVFQCVLKYFKVYQIIPEYSKITQNIPKYTHEFQSIPKNSKVSPCSVTGTSIITHSEEHNMHILSHAWAHRHDWLVSPSIPRERENRNPSRSINTDNSVPLRMLSHCSFILRFSWQIRKLSCGQGSTAWHRTWDYL